MPIEINLAELVSRLREAAGANLKSVVLYGSAVTGEFHPKHSDLNVLCVLDKLEAHQLVQLGPATRWWVAQGQPAPLAFTLEELKRAADVFAIELLDIKASHRVLFGEDFFPSLEVPMRLHHLQVERELRTNLVRLRQRYLAARNDSKTLLRLMTESVSSFASLFRHALMALGEPKPESRAEPGLESKPVGPDGPEQVPSALEKNREVIDRLAALLGFNAAGFHTALDVRQGRREERAVDIPSTFNAYLEAVTRVADEVDRRLEASSH